jgi:imidazolonepropionase-like amidohydrolase
MFRNCLFFRTGSLPACRRISSLLVIASLAIPAPAGETAPGSGDLALVGGKVFTAAGRLIEDGTVIIRGGRIAAVGLRSETPVPEGMKVVSAKGKSVIPGLVDLWSDLPGSGSPGGQPDSRSADLVEPFSETWRSLLVEGITTAAVAPEPSRGIGGLGAVLKLRSARRGEIRDPCWIRDAHLVLALGSGTTGDGPARISTAERLEVYYTLRARFQEARQYRRSLDGYWDAVEKWNKGLADRVAEADPAPAPGPTAGAEEPPKKDEKKDEKKEEKKAEEKKEEKKEPERPRPPERPPLDLSKEVLLRALDGKLPVVAVAHRASDIRFALRLKEEFGLRLAVAGATEGWREAAGIALAKAAVALGPALLDRARLDLEGHRESNGADLAAAGVPVSLSGLGGSAFPSAALRLQACILARGGLDLDRALRAITAEPAAVLGIEARVGTIEAGKDGDLVVLDGEPLSALSRVVRVIVEGVVVLDREMEL